MTAIPAWLVLRHVSGVPCRRRNVTYWAVSVFPHGRIDVLSDRRIGGRTDRSIGFLASAVGLRAVEVSAGTESATSVLIPLA